MSSLVHPDSDSKRAQTSDIIGLMPKMICRGSAGIGVKSTSGVKSPYKKDCCPRTEVQ